MDKKGTMNQAWFNPLRDSGQKGHHESSLIQSIEDSIFLSQMMELYCVSVRIRLTFKERPRW